MVNKSLLFAIIGFMLGGLVVSTAAQLEDKNDTTNHNMAVASKIEKLHGDDFDKAFMVEMMEHHQGAIDMAMLANSRAKHDEIKQMAKDIMNAQSKELDMMHTWRGDWGYKMTPSSQSSHRM